MRLLCPGLFLKHSFLCLLLLGSLHVATRGYGGTAVIVHYYISYVTLYYTRVERKWWCLQLPVGVSWHVGCRSIARHLEKFHRVLLYLDKGVEIQLALASREKYLWLKYTILRHSVKSIGIWEKNLWWEDLSLSIFSPWLILDIFNVPRLYEISRDQFQFMRFSIKSHLTITHGDLMYKLISLKLDF